MTVIRPNSISGITSLTAHRGSIDFYAHDGSAATFNNINSNVTSGVSTFASLNITGDLDVGGALTYEDVTNIDSVGIITARAGVKVPDNQKVFLGTDSDLEIYHDGSNARIRNTTGQLWLQSDNGIRFVDSDVNESTARFTDNGAVELYYDGSLKLSTAAGGVNIAGNINLNSADSYEIRLGANNDLKLYHNGSHSFVENSTGELLIRAKAGENSINCNPDGSVELYYDNSKKFETVSNGTQTTGRVFLNGTNGGFDYNNTAHTLEYLVNGSTHSELNTGAYVPQGTKNLGSNAKRWGSLYLTTGIDFGANSNAAGMASELLDDYEEGTWSPGLETSNTNGSYTLYQTQGEYIKIGSMVYFRCFVGLSAISTYGTGWLRVSGLPYAGNAGGWGQYACSVWSNSLTGINAGCKGLVNESNNRIDLFVNNNTGSGGRLVPSNLTANAAFYISGTYHVLGY